MFTAETEIIKDRLPRETNISWFTYILYDKEPLEIKDSNQEICVFFTLGLKKGIVMEKSGQKEATEW